MVTIARTERSKRKYITVVMGLEGFNVKLPEAAKAFGKKVRENSSLLF